MEKYNFVNGLKANPALRVEDVYSNYVGETDKIVGWEVSVTTHHMFQMEMWKEIVILAEGVSNHGSAKNSNCSGTDVVFDNLGRPCLMEVSQKPSSTDTFPDPIKTVFIKNK